jgi:HEAT repeat protein
MTSVMNWRRVALAAFVALVLSGVLWQARRPHEPVYQGKPLSFWLEQYYQKINAGASLPSQDEIVWDETAVAIRGIGNNAIPYLLRLAAAEDTTLKRSILNHFPISNKTMERLGLQQTFIRWAGKSVTGPMKALLGFRALGPAAKPAISELIRIMRTSQNHNGRRTAAYSLGFIGSSAQDAIPALLENFKDSNNSVRDATVRALFDIAFDHGAGQFRPECSRVMVSSLAELLADPKTDALRVIRMLSDIGPDAKAALPAILPFQNSQDPNIRAAAIKARERIETGRYARLPWSFGTT